MKHLPTRSADVSSRWDEVHLWSHVLWQMHEALENKNTAEYMLGVLVLG